MLSSAMHDDVLGYLAARIDRVSLHSSDPGDDGANETSLNRASVTWKVDGVLRLAKQVMLDVAAGPVNHFGLWTIGGAWAGSGELDEVVFTTPGVYLLDSVTVTLTSQGVPV